MLEMIHEPEKDSVLVEARNAHRQRTGHTHIFIGANFLECLECRKHAHMTDDCLQLIAHDARHHNEDTIDAKDF